MSEFALVREYLLSRLDAKGTGDGLTIVETERRQCCEMSYGFIHMIWIAAFDNTIIASLPPHTGDAIKAYLQAKLGKIEITDDAFISSLKALADGEAERLYGQKTCRCFSDLMFTCNAETLAPANPGVTPVRIADSHFSIEYAIKMKDKTVSRAYAHQTGEYQDIVADIGVETSKRYRRKGYARACVNAVARKVIENGGESLYKCAPDNIASIHTALSAGYKPYGKSLIFSVISEEKK